MGGLAARKRSRALFFEKWGSGKSAATSSGWLPIQPRASLANSLHTSGSNPKVSKHSASYYCKLICEIFMFKISRRRIKITCVHMVFHFLFHQCDYTTSIKNHSYKVTNVIFIYILIDIT